MVPSSLADQNWLGLPGATSTSCIGHRTQMILAALAPAWFQNIQGCSRTRQIQGADNLHCCSTHMFGRRDWHSITCFTLMRPLCGVYDVVRQGTERCELEGCAQLRPLRAGADCCG